MREFALAFGILGIVSSVMVMAGIVGSPFWNIWGSCLLVLNSYVFFLNFLKKE